MKTQGSTPNTAKSINKNQHKPPSLPLASCLTRLCLSHLTTEHCAILPLLGVLQSCEQNTSLLHKSPSLGYFITVLEIRTMQLLLIRPPFPLGFPCAPGWTSCFHLTEMCHCAMGVSGCLCFLQSTDSHRCPAVGQHVTLCASLWTEETTEGKVWSQGRGQVPVCPGECMRPEGPVLALLEYEDCPHAQVL